MGGAAGTAGGGGQERRLGERGAESCEGRRRFRRRAGAARGAPISPVRPVGLPRWAIRPMDRPPSAPRVHDAAAQQRLLRAVRRADRRDQRRLRPADTGELSRKRRQGILRIAGPRLAGAVGPLGGRQLDAGAAGLSADIPFAAVLVQSRDGLPLPDSRHLLVTAVARAANAGAVWGGHVLVDEGHGPVRAEPVTRPVRLPWGDGLTPDGRPPIEACRA